MTTIHHEILSAEEQEQRRQIMREALAQVRLEGLEPDPLFFEYAERYSLGQITLAQAIEDYTRQARTLSAEA